MSRIAIGFTLLMLGRVAAAADARSAPPLYDSFQPPPVGVSYLDPAFGTSVKRLSNAMYMTNNAAGGVLTSVSTEYSTASPFNRDNSWLILQHFSYFGLYDGNGNYLRDLPFAVHASSEPRWSRSERNVLFYVNGNRLMKVDVVSLVTTQVRVFPEYATINGKGESDISPDGDHFVFAGDNRHVFVYQISTGVKGPALDTAGRAFDQLYIASNGRVALGWIANGTSRFTGVELFDRNMTFVRQLTHAIGHMRLTRDTNGEDVLIWTNSNDAQPIANCQNGIVKVRLNDARQTCLIQLDWSLAVHITAADGDGWAFVETYAPSDPLPVSAGWTPYMNEILKVRLDGAEVVRLVHHRSRPVNSYEYQPRAAASRDGSRLVFASNYNLQVLYGYPKLYTDAYLLTVAQPASQAPQVPQTPQTPAPSVVATTLTQYRLYHAGTKEHLYTTDANEYDVLGKNGWMREGVAYGVMTNGYYQGVATIPLFRLYHPGIRQHHWTTDSNEANTLPRISDWVFEGTVGYLVPTPVTGTVALYRMAFPDPALHLWTTDKNEYDTLATRGWTPEGIVGYVVP